MFCMQGSGFVHAGEIKSVETQLVESPHPPCHTASSVGDCQMLIRNSLHINCRNKAVVINVLDKYLNVYLCCPEPTFGNDHWPQLCILQYSTNTSIVKEVVGKMSSYKCEYEHNLSHTVYSVLPPALSHVIKPFAQS
jgi:hypothetical protein